MSAVVSEAFYYHKDAPEHVYRANLHSHNFVSLKEDLPWITKEDYLPEGMPVNYALMICYKANQGRYGYKYFLEHFSRKECGC